MANYNFSPIGSSLVTQAVSNTAGGIGSGNITSNAGYVRTGAVVETRDSTTPTSTKGNEWAVGDIIILRSRDEITKFQAIEQDTGSSETIDWQFFNKAPE